MPFLGRHSLCGEKSWNLGGGRAEQELPSCRAWGSHGPRTYVILAFTSDLGGGKNRPQAPFCEDKQESSQTQQNQRRTECLRAQTSFSSFQLATLGREKPFRVPFSKSLGDTNFKNKHKDFSGGPGVQNPPVNAGDTGSIAGPGRSHTRQQLSHVPQLLSLCSRACQPQLLKPTCPKAYAPQQEKPPQWKAHNQRVAPACHN